MLPVLEYLAIAVLAFACLSMVIALDKARRDARVQRELILELQAAGDDERNRLSHDIHDDLGQKLALLKMQLQLSASSRCGSHGASLDASVAMVDGIIADVRALSHTLRPMPFDAGQMIPALTALAKTEGRRAGLCVLVDTQDDHLALPDDLELTCYRVVREAFNNIVKHAAARNVAVAVSCHARVLAVTVSDDGGGFDVRAARRRAARSGRLGLVGMEERVRQIGGTLAIRSHVGAGTTIECRLPLTDAV